jgi:hypothetical protein
MSAQLEIRVWFIVHELFPYKSILLSLPLGFGPFRLLLLPFLRGKTPAEAYQDDDNNQN